ncbi:hypothetical protein CN918_30125 [Priestia megaterium]|nr:hypothetical protein CN918_30125 [Priestia megaterium]
MTKRNRTTIEAVSISPMPKSNSFKSEEESIAPKGLSERAREHFEKGYLEAEQEILEGKYGSLKPKEDTIESKVQLINNNSIEQPSKHTPTSPTGRAVSQKEIDEFRRSFPSKVTQLETTDQANAESSVPAHDTIELDTTSEFERKDSHVYPALLSKMKGNYYLTFPDFRGCAATGATQEEVLEHGREALASRLLTCEKNEVDYPTPSSIEDAPFGMTFDEGDAVMLIDVHLTLYRKPDKTVLVKKTLTIPQEINDMAIEKKLNFSEILTDRLKDILGVRY